MAHFNTMVCSASIGYPFRLESHAVLVTNIAMDTIERKRISLPFHFSFFVDPALCLAQKNEWKTDTACVIPALNSLAAQYNSMKNRKCFQDARIMTGHNRWIMPYRTIFSRQHLTDHWSIYSAVGHGEPLFSYNFKMMAGHSGPN